MLARLETKQEWANVNDNTNVMGLLKLIQSHSMIKESRRNASHALFDAQRSPNPTAYEVLRIDCRI